MKTSFFPVVLVHRRGWWYVLWWIQWNRSWISATEPKGQVIATV